MMVVDNLIFLLYLENAFSKVILYGVLYKEWNR